jgi:pimeloyl-ACP methyl ester carboxylesterase
MRNLRKYGEAPYYVALIHGGPGAGGEMAPVARRLSASGDARGVLEPLQTARSLEGQVEELRTLLQDHGDLPIVLVGYSWGAWLSYIVAAQYPALMRKLILVSSGPFDQIYVESLQATRLDRLLPEERAELKFANLSLVDPQVEDKDKVLARLGELMSKADAYDPITDEVDEADGVEPQVDVYLNVWRAAEELRRSGELLGMARQIRCPVVAIHGDYDPHPADGVQIPLSASLDRFSMILLKNCGHTPWKERQARDAFYQALTGEL